MSVKSESPKNLLVFIRDQVQTQWFPEQWKADFLPTTNWLKDNGLSFSNAYASTSMCTSSRSTFFTGKFPSQHQVKHVLDENHLDNEIIQNQIQLDPQLPNLGSLFGQAGYDTVYFGKQDLQKSLTLNEIIGTDGAVVRPSSIAYTNLDEYGFGDGTPAVPDWEGKDAGGDSSDRNYGGGSADWDSKYIERAKNWLDQRINDGDEKPFVMVVSLVNPHDVLAYNSESWIDNPDHGGYASETWLDAGITALPPTVNEVKSQNNKPPIQTTFEAASNKGQQNLDSEELQLNYLNFLANLTRKADEQLGEVLSLLQEDDDLLEDTLIVNTTDHGDMSMAHGGMTQKMFNAYEETNNVLLTYSNPKLFGRNAKSSDALVSHVDFLQTIASYMGVSQDLIDDADLRGVDYSSILSAAEKGAGNRYKRLNVQDNVLFTFDDIWFGNDPATGLPNSSIHGSLPGRNRIQSIFTKDYKYNRYYSQDYDPINRASDTWNADTVWFSEYYDIAPDGNDYFDGGAPNVFNSLESYSPTPLEMKNLDPVYGGYQPSLKQLIDLKKLSNALEDSVDKRLQPLRRFDPVTGEEVIVTSLDDPSAPEIYFYNGGIKYRSDNDLKGEPAYAYGFGDPLIQFFDLEGDKKLLEIAFTTRFGNEYAVVGRSADGESVEILELFVSDTNVNYQETPVVLGTNGPTIQYRLVPDDYQIGDIGIAWDGGNVVWVADQLASSI